MLLLQTPVFLKVVQVFNTTMMKFKKNAYVEILYITCIMKHQENVCVRQDIIGMMKIMIVVLLIVNILYIIMDLPVYA